MCFEDLCENTKSKVKERDRAPLLCTLVVEIGVCTIYNMRLKLRLFEFLVASNSIRLSPLVLKNHSDTSAEAGVARGCGGKPYPHKRCSWKIIP